MQLTNKQVQILNVLVKGEGVDAQGALIPADLDQLLERLDYKTTKASIQFSIRALIARGLIAKAGMENRRGRKRVLLAPTETGKSLVSPSTPVPLFIEAEPLLPEGFLESLLK
jgi:DNA-binding MarR family transcriptional regulator